MESDDTRTRMMYEISTSNFKNLNQVIHVVLFCGDHIFDYLPDSREIRPYNAVKWERIGTNDHYEELFDLMDSIYQSLSDSFETPEEINEIGMNFAIGIRSKRILAIDLNKMKELYEEFPISDSVSGAYAVAELTVGSKIIASQCKMLITNLCELYSFWEFITSTYDKRPQINW